MRRLSAIVAALLLASASAGAAVIQSHGSTTAQSARTAPVAASSGNGFAVSCPLTFAAGAGTGTADDGTSGTCWGQQTGVYAGTGFTEAQIKSGMATGFTTVTKDLKITAAGTTVNHEWIQGCITVASGANNVTIENTLITDDGPDCSQANTGATALNAGDQNPVTATGTLVRDVTIDGTGADGKTNAITVTDGTVEQINVFGYAQGLTTGDNDPTSPTLFQDDYVHDFHSCEHDDGTWVDSGHDVVFNHIWVETNDSASTNGEGCATGACVGGSDFGPEQDVTYENSFCDGADGEDFQSGCGGTKIVLEDDVMDSTAAKFGAWGGFELGPSPNGAGNVWTGMQSIDHTGKLTALPAPANGSGC